MMTMNPKYELAYFTEIARRANPDLITCYKFSPANIHPISQLARGERYDHAQAAWLEEEFPIPQILYDRCFYSDDFDSKQTMAIVKWLKNKQDLTFLGNGLPNKWAIYEILSTSSLSPYIPETRKAYSGKNALSQLKAWRKMLLKPVSGSGGKGIFSLEKTASSIQARMDIGGELMERKFHSEHETEAWLDGIFHKTEYMLQRFLNLTDSQNRPFDIRFFLQKDMEGRWVVRGKGIRRGKMGGLLSNLNAGGEVMAFDEFIHSLDQKTKKFLLIEMREILMKVPHALEMAFPPLFELGIDLGISKDRAIWILDTNSKPGRKVLYGTDPGSKEMLYRAPLEYALFLAKKQSEREEQTS